MYAESQGEHKKKKETATCEWPVGLVFGVQLVLNSIAHVGQKVSQLTQ